MNPLAIIQSIIGTLFNVWVSIWVIAFLFISLIGISWWEIILGVILGAGIFYWFYNNLFNAGYKE